MKASLAILIFFQLFCTNFSFCTTISTVLSTFTTNLDGWGGGADAAISTVNAMSPDNPYMRKEINLTGNSEKKAKLVVRRPVDSSLLDSDPWLGDLESRGINRVELDFVNFSSDPVYLRLALSNVTNPMISTGTWWVSTTYATFLQEDGWGSASFNIIESEMKRVGDFNGGFGQDSFEVTLSNVNGFRFIGSSSGESALGDEFSGVIGMDNIQLIPEPNTSAAVMTLLTIFATLINRRFYN